VTVSRSNQLENIDLAFRLVLIELGDRAISVAFFDPQSSPFQDVPATTWKELCDQHWLEEYEIYSRRHYRLTENGWVEALWKAKRANDRN
jgi:hypothetical protein